MSTIGAGAAHPTHLTFDGASPSRPIVAHIDERPDRLAPPDAKIVS